MEQYYVGLDVHSRESTFVYRTLSRLRASPLLALCCLAVLIGSAPVRAADFGPGFKTQSVAVDGANVSVTLGGSGPPVRNTDRLSPLTASTVQRRST